MTRRRTHLLTATGPRNVGRDVANNKVAYAAIHDYSVSFAPASLFSTLGKDGGALEAVLRKQDTMAEMDWLVWADSDSIFHALEQPLNHLTSECRDADVYIFRAFGRLFTGALILRNTPAARTILKQARHRVAAKESLANALTEIAADERFSEGSICTLHAEQLCTYRHSAGGGACWGPIQRVSPPEMTDADVRTLIVNAAHVYASRHAPEIDRLVIGTAVDSSHFAILRRLACSTRKVVVDRTIIYDLGLEQEQVAEVRTWPGFELRRFDYDNMPAHMNVRIDAGYYAWKAVVVAQLAVEFGTVIYLDSGNQICSREGFDAFVNRTRLDGFASVLAWSNLRDWTHPAMLLRYDADSLADDFVQVTGGLLGLRARSQAFVSVALPWRACSMKKECIAPTGSNRSNHRQDQAALGVLAALNGINHRSFPFEAAGRIETNCDKHLNQTPCVGLTETCCLAHSIGCC